MTKIALMVILAIGSMASAATAQNTSGGFAPIGIYTGAETTPATCEIGSGMCYGDTFALNSYGETESWHLTVSLNYFNTQNHNGNGFGVMGGSWTLVVFRDNRYAGTLYGQVSGGSISLRENGDGKIISKRTQINLQATGGLGIFKGKESESINGVCDVSTDLSSNEVQGNGYFSF